MARISLKETYDNRSVIAQIAEVTDTAEDAKEKAANAETVATEASEAVAATLEQANRALVLANQASEKASEASETVAGFGNRLATVEDATEDLEDDLNAVTLRVQTAEGQIVTIQGRVTALETADGQNVKINNINQYAVGLTGNQTANGIKRFTNGISAYDADWHNTHAADGSVGDIKLFAKLPSRDSGRYIILEFVENANNAVCYGLLLVHNGTPTELGWAVNAGFGGNNPLTKDSIVAVFDGSNYWLGVRKKSAYGNLMCRVKLANYYGNIDTNPTSQIEWVSTFTNIGTGSGYTVIEAIQ